MGHIPSTTLINQATPATVTVASIPLGYDECRGFDLQQICGTNTGAWTISSSNDPRANAMHSDHANADWTDITTDIGLTDPVGGALNETVNIYDIAFDYLRIVYTSAAGAGVNRLHFSAH